MRNEGMRARSQTKPERVASDSGHTKLAAPETINARMLVKRAAGGTVASPTSVADCMPIAASGAEIPP
jgi:hypothetical protein